MVGIGKMHSCSGARRANGAISTACPFRAGLMHPSTTPSTSNRRSPMSSIKHFPAPPHIKAPPLSFGARVGDLLFISGIPGFDEAGGIADGFEAQFGFVVTNFRRVLEEAGATFRDLVKVNVLLTR